MANSSEQLDPFMKNSEDEDLKIVLSSIEIDAETQYYYWTTYKVERDFIKLTKTTIRDELKYSVKSDER